ncbi:Abi family protein [Ursidibacter arcticus]
MTTKPFKEYSEQCELLSSRGMIIQNSDYVEKKLSQIGYYRLSGFWHTARKPINETQLSDQFLPNTKFEQIHSLYLFDKKLRILLLDIIERLEVNVRTVLAHEMGRFSPLAYKDDFYINPHFSQHYSSWKDKLEAQISRSRDDFVLWHKDQNKPLPFWVVVETWDFGMLSKYYSMLKKRYQNQIARRFNVDNTATLISWLNEINIIRNQAAHHSRIWNRKGNPIKTLNNTYFIGLSMDENSQRRLFGRIAVMWYLVSQTSTNYKWLERVNKVLDDFPDVPNAKIKALGLMHYKCLPLDLMRL